MILIVGRAYCLRGLNPGMWDNSHPKFGRPFELAARYLGSLQGTRRWHGFEVRVDGADEGVIFMNDGDLDQLEIECL